MTLARVRNPEALRYQAPGEWGAILGLDRCPEPKTLRRKIRLLASAEHTVRDWQSALARTWATEHDDDWATLAVDGHVKVYAGRNGRLPKHFVARQKLCMPASVSYWINALGGTPLMCLHKALDPKLIKALEQDVVPHLQHLGVVPESCARSTRTLRIHRRTRASASPTPVNKTSSPKSASSRPTLCTGFMVSGTTERPRLLVR